MIGAAVGVPVPLACAVFTAVIGGTCFATTAPQMDRINSVLVALVRRQQQMHVKAMLSDIALVLRELHDAGRRASVATALTRCCSQLRRGLPCHAARTFPQAAKLCTISASRVCGSRHLIV